MPMGNFLRGGFISSFTHRRSCREVNPTGTTRTRAIAWKGCLLGYGFLSGFRSSKRLRVRLVTEPHEIAEAI
jgi:hypothetical protein